MTTLIQRNVMRRVRTIYTLRLLASPLVLAPSLFVVSLFAVGREVWVARVLENLSSITTPGALGHFFVAAYLNTGAAVQVLMLVLAFAGVWFSYGIYKLLDQRDSFALAS